MALTVGNIKDSKGGKKKKKKSSNLYEAWLTAMYELSVSSRRRFLEEQCYAEIYHCFLKCCYQFMLTGRT